MKNARKSSWYHVAVSWFIRQFLDVNIRGLLKVLVKEKYETPSDAPFYSFHMTAEVLISQYGVPGIQALHLLHNFV